MAAVLKGAAGMLFCHLSAKLDDLALHLCISRSLANTLEVVFDLAAKVEALATSAHLKGLLHNIASQLP